MMIGVGASRAVIDGAGKFAVADFSVPQFNFVRTIFAVAVLLPTLLRGQGLRALHTSNPLAHGLRAALQAVIVSIWYLGLRHLELADATAISMGSPIIVTVMSALVLKEHIGPRRWAAVAVGFCGMLLIIRPGTSLFDPWALLPLGVSFCYSAFLISSRALRHGESVAALTLYPQFGILISSGIGAVFAWQPLTQAGLWAMAIGGVMGAVSHLGMTLAPRWAPASVLAPMDYVPLVWAIILGFVMFGDLPDAYTVTGAALIVGAGIFIAYRESKVGNLQRSIDAA